MKINHLLTDSATLNELGKRLAFKRISENLTQEEAAKKAGISKRTIERIESGSSTQVSSLIRILRSYNMLEKLNNILPEVETSPLEILRKEKQQQKYRAKKSTKTASKSSWRWDENT